MVLKSICWLFGNSHNHETIVPSTSEDWSVNVLVKIAGKLLLSTVKEANGGLLDGGGETITIKVLVAVFLLTPKGKPLSVTVSEATYLPGLE